MLDERSAELRKFLKVSGGIKHGKLFVPVAIPEQQSAEVRDLSCNKLLGDHQLKLQVVALPILLAACSRRWKHRSLQPSLELAAS
jgi:hypothetical protein